MEMIFGQGQGIAMRWEGWEVSTGHLKARLLKYAKDGKQHPRPGEAPSLLAGDVQRMTTVYQGTNATRHIRTIRPPERRTHAQDGVIEIPEHRYAV